MSKCVVSVLSATCMGSTGAIIRPRYYGFRHHLVGHHADRQQYADRTRET